MRFLLDTNILIPLEDSKVPLVRSLANFVRLANANGHSLVYHPASEEDILQDTDVSRRNQTLQRLIQYTRLDPCPECPWNSSNTNRNDAVDNEILYALHLNAIHGLITEDKGIHTNAKARDLAHNVYTIQTAEDLLQRLHESIRVNLPSIEEVPLYALTPQLSTQFFDSLRNGYSKFDGWFNAKAREGRRAWIHRDPTTQTIGGLCIFTRQDDEQITEKIRLSGPALKLATFKVGDENRGRKIGELFLKMAFRYAYANKLTNIFIHGDTSQHHFLFELLEDFGFRYTGSHCGNAASDAVYVKSHPLVAPSDLLAPFDYLRMYFPHFRRDKDIQKYIVPIKPQYHKILFPDYLSPADPQEDLFEQPNHAGNAIKLAYLCHSQTRSIRPGDIVLFYRSTDERAVTSLGVAETYQTLDDADKIISQVKRRTVYRMDEIVTMARKPTRVMLFRLIKHFNIPLSQSWLETEGILHGPPQSIVKVSDESFEKIYDAGQ